MTETLRVTRLRTYPVKSLAGNDVDTATVEPWGLRGDRRWGIVDDSGTKVTAREISSLLGLRAQPLSDAAISIADAAGDTIVVNVPTTAPTIPVKYSRLDHATSAGTLPDAWLTARVGRSVHLVWQADPTHRTIAGDHGGLPGESLTLADAGPLLLVSESSMQQLNDWTAADTGATEPLDIVRFRPNVIVNGEAAFAEDRWVRLRIGGVEFRRTMLCDRCVMTTIEPTTLAKGKEPIRTLARHRRWDRKTWFGIRMTPVGLDSPGPKSSGPYLPGEATINAGDPVEVELD